MDDAYVVEFRCKWYRNPRKWLTCATASTGSPANFPTRESAERWMEDRAKSRDPKDYEYRVRPL